MSMNIKFTGGVVSLGLLTTCHIMAQCKDLRNAPLEDVAAYIREAGVQHIQAECVRVAYSSITSFETKQQIPILLSLLSVARPATESELQSEKDGINFVSSIPTPIDRYPAAQLLLALGRVAEPAVLDYIAKDPYRDATGWQNAIYVFVSGGRQRAESLETIVDLLKAKRAQLANATEISRVDDAIRFLANKYCENSREAACRAAAQSP